MDIDHSILCMGTTWYEKKNNASCTHQKIKRNKKKKKEKKEKKREIIRAKPQMELLKI